MKKTLVLFLLFFSIIFLSACSFNKNINNNNITASGESIKIASSTSPVNNSIVSERLGIKISYYSDSVDQVWAREDGNKIYFWNKFSENNYKDGQSFEVFTKDKEVLFEDAIENMFLKDERYKNNCSVLVIEDAVQYRKAIIDFKNKAKFPENTNCINGDTSPNCDSCPAHYSKTNASLFFIYYKEHPDKFLYLDLGQSSLIGGYDYYWYGNGDSREWFNNIEFIEQF